MDDVGLAVVAGDEAEGGESIRVDTGMEPGFDPGDEARQVGDDLGVECRMRVRTRPVPLRQTQVLRIPVQEDLALHQHQEVRFHRQVSPAEGFHQAGHVAAGVDDPLGAFALQVAEELLQVVGHRWVFEFGEERAVEICRDELDGVGGHRAAE